MQTIDIKNMVCQRCILVVNQILEKLKLSGFHVELGKVLFDGKLSDSELSLIQVELKKVGFELLMDEESVLVTQIKTYLLKEINKIAAFDKVNMSRFLEQKTGKRYNYLSKLFSVSEGKTIERFFIELRVEKIKELIKYEKATISEISYDLGYSSPQHLARQFKQITGMTTSEFKKIGDRKKLDKI